MGAKANVVPVGSETRPVEISTDPKKFLTPFFVHTSVSHLVKVCMKSSEYNINLFFCQ